MPKEAFTISQYHGLHGGSDTHDLPEGMAFYAENLDMITRHGHFTGLNRDLPYNSNAVYSYLRSDWIQLFKDGAEGILKDDTSLRWMTFSNSETSPTFSLVASSTVSVDSEIGPTMAAAGEAVRVGMGPNSSYKPQWCGYRYHDQFDSNPETSAQREIIDAELTKDSVGFTRYAAEAVYHLPDQAGTNISTFSGTYPGFIKFDNSTVNFPFGSVVRYYASTTYDGSQQSPARLIAEFHIRRSGLYYFEPDDQGGNGSSTGTLSMRYNELASTITNQYFNTPSGTSLWDTVTGQHTSVNADVPIEGLRALEFNVHVCTTADNLVNVVSPRATGMRLYRSVSALDELGEYTEEEPSFIVFVPFHNDDDWTWSSTTSGNGTRYYHTAGYYKKITIVDDYPGTNPFSDDTGFSHALDHMKVHYGVSCMANGYHIVGRAWVDDLYDTQTWLFRSKAWKHDTFDWSQDYLVLPRLPNALVYFQGRVFAFCDAYTYVINPDIFDIEDEWEGVGCADRKTIATGEQGMFWADSMNIYHYRNGVLETIGQPVLELTRTLGFITSYGANQVGWNSRDTDADTAAVYVPEYDSFMLFYSVTQSIGGYNEGRALMYHVPTKRWTTVTQFGSESGINQSRQHVRSAVIMADGSACVIGRIGTAHKLLRLFGDKPTVSDPYRRQWIYTSKQLGKRGSMHRYYKLRIAVSHPDKTITESEPPQVRYYKNDPDYTNAITTTKIEPARREHVWDYRVDSVGNWEDYHNFAIEMRSYGQHSVSEVTIIRREKTPR